VADFMSGAHLYGAIVTALYERERTGRGHAYTSKAVPERSGNRHVADSYVPFDTFETSDGHVAVVCATDEHWAKLTEAMGRPDLTQSQTLRTLAGRIEHIDEVTAIVAEWTRTQTREQVSALCEKYRIPAAPLRNVIEVLNDPHLRERGFLTEHATEHGTVALPNSPMRYVGSAPRTLVPPPQLGQHTDEVLAHLCGLDKAELARLHSDGVI
jgi:crotonobetainyl-CoA:carnitine CoA-transferase CaiB-like acyl-CoA transferase